MKRRAIKTLVDRKAKALSRERKRANRVGTSNVDKMVTAPAAIGNIYRTPGMTKKGYSRSTMRVKRSEILQLSVSPTTNYEITSYEVNPGNSLMFSWLYPIARRYELFRFHNIKFTYHPSCSTAKDGRVVMAFEPDFDDPTPENLLEAQQIGGAVGFSPWATSSLSVDKKLLSSSGTNALYTMRADAEAPTTSNSLGRFYIATAGTTTTGEETGFVTVDYDVELSVPQVHDYLVGGYLQLHAAVDGTTYTTFLDDPVVSQYSNMQDWGVTWEGTTLTFPANIIGSYHVLLFMNAQSAVGAISAAPTVTGGVTVHAYFEDGNDTLRDTMYSGSSSSAVSAAFQIMDIHIDGTGGTLELDTPASYTGPDGNAYVIIHELSKHHNNVALKAGMKRGNLTTKAPYPPHPPRVPSTPPPSQDGKAQDHPGVSPPLDEKEIVVIHGTQGLQYHRQYVRPRAKP